MKEAEGTTIAEKSPLEIVLSETSEHLAVQQYKSVQCFRFANSMTVSHLLATT